MKNICGISVLVLFLISCVNDKPNSITTNSIKQDTIVELPDTFNINVAEYQQDSCFEQNSVRLCVFHKKELDGYNGSAFVQLLTKTTKEKILDFGYRAEFLYYFYDLNDDGFKDLHLFGDPMRSHLFYLFNPKINRFVEAGRFNLVWTKLDKNLFYDYVEDYSDDSDFNSSLFTIDSDYKVKILAVIERDRDADDNLKLEVVKLDKEGEEVWREEVDSELIYANKDGEIYKIPALIGAIWKIYQHKIEN